jgi:ribosomal protein S27E
MLRCQHSMSTADESARCDKCGRALATRMRREGDRVRTYLECPVCARPVEDETGPRPEPEKGEPTED